MCLSSDNHPWSLLQVLQCSWLLHMNQEKVVSYVTCSCALVLLSSQAKLSVWSVVFVFNPSHSLATPPSPKSLPWFTQVKKCLWISRFSYPFIVFLLTAQNECSECCVHPNCFTEFFCDLNVVVCQFIIKRNRDITTLSIILKHGKMSLFSVVFFPSILMTDVIPASPIMLTEYCMTIKKDSWVFEYVCLSITWFLPPRSSDVSVVFVWSDSANLTADAALISLPVLYQNEWD